MSDNENSVSEAFGSSPEYEPSVKLVSESDTVISVCG